MRETVKCANSRCRFVHRFDDRPQVPVGKSEYESRCPRCGASEFFELNEPVKQPRLSGAQLIELERRRQDLVERYTDEHDDAHNKFELTLAAISYAQVVASPDADANGKLSASRETWDWPWARSCWKPSDDPIRNLVKAGALIAAEIDRLQRLKEVKP